MKNKLQEVLNEILLNKNNVLRPENLRKGKKLLGIEGVLEEGVDTSDADALSENVLQDKTVYVKSQKIVGTMPNNGQLTFTPSSEAQTIPTGYTSGGSVEAFDLLKSEDYLICCDLSRVILGTDSKNPVTQGLLLNLEAKGYSVSSSSGVVNWYDSIKQKNITVRNGTVNRDYSINFNGSSTEFNSGVSQAELVEGYTVVTRIKPDVWNNYRGVAGLHGRYNMGMVLWQYVDGTIACGNIDTTINQIGTLITPEQLPINEWTIVSTTYNKETGLGITYIGQEEVNRSAQYGTLKPDGDLIVGKGLSSAERFFDGSMSHFIVYNRPLSQEEISQVANYIAAEV